MKKLLYLILSLATFVSLAVALAIGYCLLENKAFTQTPQKITIEIRTVNKIKNYNFVVCTIKDLGGLVGVVKATSTDTDEETIEEKKNGLAEDEVTTVQSSNNIGKTAIYIGTDEDLKYFCFTEYPKVGETYTVVTTTQHNTNCSPSMQKTLIVWLVLSLIIPLIKFLFGHNLKEGKPKFF